MNCWKLTLCISLSLVFLFSCKSENKKKENIEAKAAIQKVEKIKEEIVEKAAVVEKIKQADYDTVKWTEVSRLDKSIQIDMKYASTDNFVEEKMYDCSRCFLRPEVAKAVVKAQDILQKKGYGLKMLDCYRPRPVQQKLWDKVPNPSYVTPPKKGSMHNRGSAVDLTLVDESGKELDMGTAFDFFGKRAHHDFTDLPQEILDRRILLKTTMKKVGLYPIRTEWWHYYYAAGAPKNYEISDMLWKCDHSEASKSE